MSKLRKQLEDWTSKDLISTSQAKKILDFEEGRPQIPWVLYSFLILGSVVLAIGIVSIIAANWFQIPNLLKLSFNFIFLAANAYAVFWAFEKKKSLLYEVLLIFFMLFNLASIGLVSQIYHTGGEFYHALLLWSLITIGVAVASKKMLAPIIWAAGFFVGYLYFSLKSESLNFLYEGHAPPIYMSIPLLSGCLYYLIKKIGGGKVQSRSLIWSALMGGFVSVIVLDTHRDGYHMKEVVGIASLIPSYLLSIILVVAIRFDSGLNRIQKALLGTILLIFIVPFHFEILGLNHDLFIAISTLILLVFVAIFSASLKVKNFFQFLIFCIGLRFLILYFQAFGGLAKTGLGLVLSGVAILIFVLVWNKYSKKIANWAEGLVE